MVAFYDNQAAGVLIAFSGDEIARRRRADLVALISTLHSE
jgi:hypothetical protein